MFKYKDNVRIIKDPENDGFFEGVEGVIMERNVSKEGVITYGVDFNHYQGIIWCKPEELLKLN